ncbi:MAG: hypothetical protein AB1664_22420 [Thermodesulfobacteriota bacterium]
MVLNVDQLKGLMRGLSKTREHELNCNECLDKMAEFAERELAGKPVPDALEAVQHHLSICGECSEEYDALLTALQHLKEEESPSK